MQNNKLSHCPYCTKVLFKDASFKDEADFETNCHHCGKPIVVCVEKELILIIKPRIQVKLSEKSPDQNA